MQPKKTAETTFMVLMRTVVPVTPFVIRDTAVSRAKDRRFVLSFHACQISNFKM